MSTRNLLTSSLTLLMVAVAHGHALHVLRGTVTVETSVVRVEVTLSERERNHLGRAIPDALDPAWYGQRLASGLTVRNRTGEVIVAGSISQRSEDNQVTYQLTYPRDGDRFVLRYLPAATSGLREQLALSAATPAQTRAASLQLTSFGNPQYLIIDPTSDEVRRDRSALGHCAALQPEQPAFAQQPILSLENGRGVLTVPLHLLASWGWIEGESVTDSQWQTCKPTITRELCQRLLVDDQPAAGRLRLVGPGSPAGVSVWTGHVEFGFEADSGTTLTYRLFNPRMQQVQVLRHTDAGCQVQTVGSFRPELRIP